MEQEVTETAAFTVGDVKGTAYNAGTADKPVYIGSTSVVNESDGTVTTTYYALTKSDSGYTVAGGPLEVTGYQVVVDGTVTEAYESNL